MAKTKLEKHLEELEESTSGNAHDAVTFSGKGLGFLRDLFKGAKKMDKDEDEDDMDDDLDDDLDDEEDEIERKQKQSTRRAEKSKTRKNRNGGDLEEEDDDPEDPGDDGDEEIITNHGERLRGEGAVKRAKKNAGNRFDERRFVKSMNEFEDVLDASPALEELTRAVRVLGKSASGTRAQVEAVMEQNVLLGRAVRELLKSNAALAADMELIKKQPATSPAMGFAVMGARTGTGQAGARRMSKSELADTITDLMSEGVADPQHLAMLQRARTEAELTQFVNSLPDAVRERL